MGRKDFGIRSFSLIRNPEIGARPFPWLAGAEGTVSKLGSDITSLARLLASEDLPTDAAGILNLGTAHRRSMAEVESGMLRNIFMGSLVIKGNVQDAPFYKCFGYSRDW